jgi:hypothetical protein
MKYLVLFSLAALFLSPASLSAGEDWAAALDGLPLRVASREFSRTNCIECVLRSFQPNSVVKGIAFLPGATDELYLTHRVQPRLSSAPATLLDAVHSLTNGTVLQATFHPPLLLIHTPSDPLEPIIATAPEASMPTLAPKMAAAPVVLVDRDWDWVQPVVREGLGIEVLPRKRSKDSWHFYRLNLVGMGLSAHEMIEAVCLASKTRATLEQHRGLFGKNLRLVFSPDKRLVTP